MEPIKPIYDFSSEKNQQLIAERGLSFEDIIVAINDGRLLDIIEHSNQKKYPGQWMYVVNLDNYIHLVPFVRKSEQEVFLKTIFPSRKLTKQYMGET